MSKIAKCLEILRKSEPIEKDLYVQWLEERVDALVSLRLLEMGRYVNKAINANIRHKMEINELREEIDKLQNPRDEEGPKQKTRKSKTRDGYVYLLKVHNSENLYKIGRTINPDNRLRTFGVKLPFIVSYEHLIKCDDMYRLEYRLHRKYQKQRKNGSEFFTLADKDVQFIKSVQSCADVKVNYPSIRTTESEDA